MKNVIAKTTIAGLTILQQSLFLAVPATVTTSTVLLTACATPSDRAQTRQETRVEQRTKGRYEDRRGDD